MHDHRGHVPTSRASRYLQQLCKHWSHRFAVEFDASAGSVDFGDGSSLDLVAKADRLVMVIHGPQEAIITLERIVVEHVDRFAHREKLFYEWGI
ncbi:DUF2218 domain-containing protein [Sphingomonas sp. GB1N7]|uniref:DUF2218 domain-containing protein n=1 Tax=Parasphingomonas caseinilytica TaxID=3096158 RepID=UPI002FCA5DC9